MENTKEITIAEAATEALAEIALKKELAALESKIGTDPASEESIARLAQQIRESKAELEAVPQELRRDKNYKIAQHCHDMLKAEWEAQNRKLIVDQMLTDLLKSVIQLRDSLNEGQRVIDNSADLHIAIGRKFFKFYADKLTPAIDKCLNSEVGDILPIPVGKV